MLTPYEVLRNAPLDTSRMEELDRMIAAEGGWDSEKRKKKREPAQMGFSFMEVAAIKSRWEKDRKRKRQERELLRQQEGRGRYQRVRPNLGRQANA